MFKKITIIVSIVTVTGLILAFSGLLSGSGKNDSGLQSSTDRFFMVKKDNLILGIELTGTVNAKKQHKLACEAAYQTKLVSIVDENSKVRKNDVLAEFETEDLEQKIEDLVLKLDNEKKELLISQEEKEILISSNLADIEKTKNQVMEAQDSFNKYWKLEGPQARDVQDNKVGTAKRGLEEAKEAYLSYRDEISQTVYSNAEEESAAKSKLATMKQTFNNTKTAYNNSLFNLKILKRYTHPNKITTLQNRLNEVKLNLKRVKIKTASSMIQKDNQIYHMERKIRYLKREVEKHKDFLPLMKLIAPVDGLVIYGDPARRRYKTEIKIGMDIARREILITIPDLSELVVNFEIPEQYRGKVKIDDKVILTPESIPTLKVSGILKHIDPLPVNLLRWDPNSPKIYHASITVVEKNKELVSGMNVKIAIINKILKNRLLVPIEAVFEKNGQYFVYLKTDGNFKEVDVVIGDANDNLVEIKKGLNENDYVCLYRPYQSSNGKE